MAELTLPANTKIRGVSPDQYISLPVDGNKPGLFYVERCSDRNYWLVVPVSWQLQMLKRGQNEVLVASVPTWMRIPSDDSLCVVAEHYKQAGKEPEAQSRTVAFVLKALTRSQKALTKALLDCIEL